MLFVAGCSHPFSLCTRYPPSFKGLAKPHKALFRHPRYREPDSPKGKTDVFGDWYGACQHLDAFCFGKLPEVPQKRGRVGLLGRAGHGGYF